MAPGGLDWLTALKGLRSPRRPGGPALKARADRLRGRWRIGISKAHSSSQIGMRALRVGLTSGIILLLTSKGCGFGGIREQAREQGGKLLSQALFANESVRPVPEAGCVTGRALIDRSDERAHRRILLPKALDQLETVHARHLQIGNDQVGPEPGGQGKTIGGVARLPGDADPQIRSQQPGQHGSGRGRIIHQNDTDLAVCS